MVVSVPEAQKRTLSALGRAHQFLSQLKGRLRYIGKVGTPGCLLYCRFENPLVVVFSQRSPRKSDHDLLAHGFTLAINS